MDAETRFIADVMLGKLATWLRLLGCDVEYFPKITDEDLVERASRTGRVILTRDTGGRSNSPMCAVRFKRLSGNASGGSASECDEASESQDKNPRETDNT